LGGRAPTATAATAARAGPGTGGVVVTSAGHAVGGLVLHVALVAGLRLVPVGTATTPLAAPAATPPGPQPGLVGPGGVLTVRLLLLLRRGLRRRGLVSGAHLRRGDPRGGPAGASARDVGEVGRLEDDT